jgi:hypothetical protein
MSQKNLRLKILQGNANIQPIFLKKLKKIQPIMVLQSMPPKKYSFQKFWKEMPTFPPIS